MPPPGRDEMLERIRAIPGNQAVLDGLRSLLEKRSAIGFVGAGASFPLYPLWTQFIRKLAHEPVRLGLATDADEEYWLRKASERPLLVASQIRVKLTDTNYHAFLYETFKGLDYTPTHAALVRLDFKALVTTNYDSGLVEARRVFRPDIRSTGYTLWNQPFPLDRWVSGDIFGEGRECPILFAHGYFDDAPGIVLDRDSYHKAYHDPPYRRFFENLWVHEHLVCIGFSFHDITLAQIAEEMIWQAFGPPRHIAILGLPEEYVYTDQMRREFMESYGANPLFYPVTLDAQGHEDHSALQVLLDSLAGEAAPPPQTPTARARLPLAMRFAHESTEDEKFTGREDALARLDRWASDSDVRLVAVTAVGGLGKTALIGRWLKQGRAAAARGFQGGFFWSFYRDREERRFFEALVAYGREERAWTPGDANAPARDQAQQLLEACPLVVALDGLEVIQGTPGTVTYGELLGVGLADFLHRHCNGNSSSLVLLTSRFPFPDLTSYLGGSLRSLPLGSLEPTEGADLLASVGLRGQPADREEISRKLEGHPLALRVFARSMPPDLRGDPTRLWEQIFDPAHLVADDSLEGKMRRLLGFYEARLPDAHRQALGLVALFRMPVAEATLAPLWEKLLNQPAGGGLRSALEELRREHLLTADPGADGEPRYACHPILRDYFRAQLLGESAFARAAATLLAGPPDTKAQRSLETIQTVATAIELLLDAGDVKAANDLYTSRGKLFMWHPAPHWGLAVARGFVRDEGRRGAVRQEFGARGLSFFLASCGLFASLAGEPETALRFHGEAVAACREAGDQENLSRGLLNLSDVEMSLGLLAAAAGRSAEALDLATNFGDGRERGDFLARAGHAASLRGQVGQADRHFAEANAIENRIEPYTDDL
jgi:tetratricopeptide (TPR) repeat protein